MCLEVEPISGPADETPSVKVIDGLPQSEVTITVAVTDAKDHHWESRNVFRTDSAGTVDLSRDAPVSGAMGPSIRQGLSGRCTSAARTSPPQCSQHPVISWSSASPPSSQVKPRARFRSVVGVVPALHARRFRVMGASGSCTNRSEMARTRRLRSSRELLVRNLWSPRLRCSLPADTRRWS